MSERKASKSRKPSRDKSAGTDKSVKTDKSAAADTGRPGSPMNVGLLEQIVKLMRSNDLTTVEVSEGDKRILLRRGEPASPGGQAYAPAPHASTSAPAAASPTPPPAAVSDEANLVPIKSIMVGTFYAAPSPDAKAFVSVGSQVNDETDVCVIEAMKVYNTIKAECTGTIAKVVATNGQSVEFGQTLFLVRP